MSSTKLQQHHHHHPHHRHAPFIHDLGLMNWLIGIWLGIVIAGFMLDKGIHFVRDHSLFPSFSSSFAPITSDDTWIHLESHGDVELMYRTIVPTLGLHAHRAVVVADLPIESLLHVFRDTPNDVRIFRYHEICTWLKCLANVLIRRPTCLLSICSDQMGQRSERMWGVPQIRSSSPQWKYSNSDDHC